MLSTVGYRRLNNLVSSLRALRTIGSFSTTSTTSAGTNPARTLLVSPPNRTMSTYLITGCSGGIGLELVKQLAARGDKVYATCRKKEASATGVDAISEVEGNVTIIEGVDVTSDDCKEKLSKALEGRGKIEGD
jgi:NADPH:quinone reductase-like Zn-dependent oxidoreductase